MFGTILIIILIMFLFGGLAPWGQYPNAIHGYGYGGGGVSVISIILIVVVVLLVTGRL